jgi:hypothetical protein
MRQKFRTADLSSEELVFIERCPDFGNFAEGGIGCKPPIATSGNRWPVRVQTIWQSPRFYGLT